MESDGDAAAFAAAMVRAGAKVTVGAHRVVVVRLTGDEVYDTIRDVALAQGVGIRRLTRRIATLEDVFMEAGS